MKFRLSLTNFMILLFMLVCIYFLIYYNKNHESFNNLNVKSRCPNLLIQQDSKFYLYNSKEAKVPGVNPIEFENLEDYVEFLDWQRSQGIRCPVLYLQSTIDAQGNETYRIKPSVTEPQHGLPLQSNSNVDVQSPDFDLNFSQTQTNDDYYIGVTNVDQHKVDSKKIISPDPMDDNWGGAQYTQKLIDDGYYKGNEVQIYIP